eukprot:1435337-Prymnesium_polylepis.1
MISCSDPCPAGIPGELGTCTHGGERVRLGGAAAALRGRRSPLHTSLPMPGILAVDSPRIRLLPKAPFVETRRRLRFTMPSLLLPSSALSSSPRGLSREISTFLPEDGIAVDQSRRIGPSCGCERDARAS